MASYTQQQVDALRAAIAEGVLSVQSAGRAVTYRSLSEMQNLLRIMEADLASSASARTRRVYQQFRRD